MVVTKVAVVDFNFVSLVCYRLVSFLFSFFFSKNAAVRKQIKPF